MCYNELEFILQIKEIEMILNVFKRVFQILFTILFILMIVATVIVGMLGFSIVRIMEDSPKINPKTILLDLNENSKIVDNNGKLIESIAYDEYREIVKYDKIPKKLIDAFISIEDERFETHNGIDFIGIGKSFLDNILAGRIVRGGSTITQQLVKNIYLSEDVQWERKITEIYLALEVDSKLSKEEILESYLNRVYLGQHSYGIKVAAYTYFSKPLSELSLAQCATLAGIVNAPSAYSLFYSFPPTSVPKDAKVLGEYSVAGENFVAVLNEEAFSRKDQVLKKMFELGKITQAEYDQAMKEDVASTVKPGSKKAKEYSSHISELIKKQAIEKISASQNISEEDAANILYTGGLTIKTTIDWEMQKKLEEVYKNFTNILSDHDNGVGPFLADFELDEYENIINSNGTKIYYKKSNLLTENNEYYVPEGYFKIKENKDLNINSSRFMLDGDYLVVKDFYTVNDQNNLVTYRSGSIAIPADHTKKEKDGSITIKADFFKKINDFYAVKDNVLVLNKKYYKVETQGTVQPQAATIIIDSKNGEIKAMVGARGNSEDDTINRVIGFPRQPGSSIKPIAVYAPAVDSGYTLASPLDDTPFEIQNGEAWPSNVYQSYSGILTLREALSESANTTAVKLLDAIGIKTSKNYLERFGIINAKDPSKDNYISSKEDPNYNDENVAFSLGAATEGFTVMDMAQAYLAFPGEGSRKEAMIISEITSAKTGQIYKNEHKNIPVISPQTAFLITDVLKDVIDYGPYSGARNDYDIDTAGKTGTTDGSADVWYAGFNPYYTSVSWIGFDNNNIRVQGTSAIATTFYGSYMNEIIKDLEPVEFVKPNGIVQLQVSKVDGLLPNEYTSKDPRGNMVITEYFDEKNVPKEVSTAHVLLKVDSRNNLLAKPDLPKFLVKEKVFIKRPIKYDPQEFNGILPADWKYQAPTEYSNLKFVPISKTEKLADGTIVETQQSMTGEIKITYTYPNGRVVIHIKHVDGTETVQEIPAPTPNPNPNQQPKPNDNQNNN